LVAQMGLEIEEHQERQMRKREGRSPIWSRY
jgi:hypothetical protein